MSSPLQACSDFRRIDALPRRIRTDADDAEAARILTARYSTGAGQCPDRAMRCPLALTPIQGRLTLEAAAMRGAVGAIPAGGGKTLPSLLIPAVVGAEVPVLVVPAALRDKTRIEWAHYAKHWRVHSSIHIIAFEQLSRVSYNDWLATVQPDCIIVDECFDAGTLIETRQGPRPIETLTPGNFVLSADGTFQRIERVMSRESAEHLDIVLSGHRVKTTPNHPILTDRGWVAAGKLTLNDRVRILRRGPREGRAAYVPGLARVALVERRSDAPRRVYNLTVEGSSTYVLSESGAVVHNCHRAKNPKAACTRKLHGYIESRRAIGAPLTVVVMSGTMSRTSLRDHATLQRLALGDGAPVPHRSDTVTAWNAILGEGDEADNLYLEAGVLADWARPDLLGPEREAVAWAGSRASIRVGFRQRMLDTPGVIGSAVAPCDAALTLDAWTPPVPDVVTNALAALYADGEMPDGQTCGDALELYRHESTLALGFWDRWKIQPPAIWRQSRRLWHNVTRRILANSKKRHSVLDVANAIDRGEIADPNLREYVTRWEIAKVDELMAQAPPDLTVLRCWRAVEPAFAPSSAPVWLCDDLVRAAGAWLEREKGVVWVDSVAFGRALEGLGFSYYGAGGLDKRKRTIETASGPIVASVASSGTGRNLQQWHTGLVVQPDQDAVTNEQMIARHHRPGQLADEVTFTYACFVDAHRRQLDKAWERSILLSDTWGQPQKLLIATQTDALRAARNL